MKRALLLIPLLFLMTSCSSSEDIPTIFSVMGEGRQEGNALILHDELVHLGDSPYDPERWTAPEWQEVPEPAGQGMNISFVVDERYYTALRIEVHGSEHEKNLVRLNGEHLGFLPITGENGWATAEIPLPGGALDLEENSLLITAGKPDDIMVRRVALE